MTPSPSPLKRPAQHAAPVDDLPAAKPSIVRVERLESVLSRTGFTRTPLLNAIGRGLFPKPIKLKPSRNIGFLSHEVDAWIAARVAERDAA